MSIRSKQWPQNQAILAREGIDATGVLDRFMYEAELSKDSELAALFGVSKPTITTWRKRNTIPYEEVLVACLERKLDFIYCILGRRADEIARGIELNRRLSEKEATDARAAFSRAVRSLERLAGFLPRDGDKKGDK